MNGTGRWLKSSALAPLLLLAFASPATTDETEALWRLLQGGGQVVVTRHATTEPGVGDPPSHADVCWRITDLEARKGEGGDRCDE